MQIRTRRDLLGAAVGLAVGGLAGCLGDDSGTGPASRSGTGGTGATDTATEDADPPTTSPSGGVHGDPYPVSIRVTARPVDEEAVPVPSVPSMSAADVTEAERALLVEVVERGETDTWSGTSDEVPPEWLRDLVAGVDRLAPSRADRDPADAWRLAREATAYVAYENETYRIEMVKVAP